MIWGLALVVFVGGWFIPPGTLDGNLGTLVVTFFGLVSAGILPAISLLVGNTLSSSLSVRKLDELKAGLDSLMRKLLETLGFLVIGAVLIMVQEVGLPNLPKQVFEVDVPGWLQEAPIRVVQAGVLACFFVGMDRIRLVASAFRRVLTERYELARADSVERIRKNAGSIGEVRNLFPKTSNFGNTVVVSEIPKPTDQGGQ